MDQQGSSLTQELGDVLISGPGTKPDNRADQAASIMGEKLRSAAETLRGRLSSEGRLGAAAETVADRLQSAGRYLQEQGMTGAIEEVEALIRRYPIQTLLLGAGLGYALSRLRMRSR